MRDARNACVVGLFLAAAACSQPGDAASPGAGQGAAASAAATGGAGGVAGMTASGGSSGASAGVGGGAGGMTAGTSAGVSAISGGTGAAGDGSASGGTGGTGIPMTDAGMPADDAELPDDDQGIWIAIDGDDMNAGTSSAPLATLPVAIERATAGATIWVKPGTYDVAQTVAIRASGTDGNPIRIFAAEGARPVFDFSAQPRGESSARGLQISGSYWHIRGIDVINAGDNCIHISGSHNTLERVDTYGCSDSGVQITANSSEAGDATRAAYNTVINCDSHDNYDEANQGENADGFAAKLYIGPGNVFRGCRAWNNADDGWDLFASDDVVVIEDCWAIANGKIGPAQNNTNGDGNGFKLGGAARAGDANMGGAVHMVSGCVSIENRACGFVRNNNTDVPVLSMCGGRGDEKDLVCSLSIMSPISVSTTADEAIAAARESDGSLPPLP